MIVRAWRITKSKHAPTAFSGSGAEAFGGRWNSPGSAVVYAAGSVSLAILEMLVQVDDLLRRYVIFEARFDEALVKTVEPAALPKGWRNSPSPTATQRIGDAWIARADSAVLQLPCVIVPTEWNYLLNPAHPDFLKIALGPKQPIRFDV